MDMETYLFDGLRLFKIEFSICTPNPLTDFIRYNNLFIFTHASVKNSFPQNITQSCVLVEFASYVRNYIFINPIHRDRCVQTFLQLILDRPTDAEACTHRRILER